MKLRVMSDLHLLHYRDHGDALQQKLNPLSPDEVLVLAGDIVDSAGTGGRFRKRMQVFAEKWKRVVYVAGNHEYYGSSPFAVHRAMRFALADLPNVTWLDNSAAEIDGVRFYGGTLWFPYDMLAKQYERYMTDFHVIEGFTPWVYEQHRMFRDGLERIEPGGVIVSHHLPSYQSVHPRFQGPQAGALNSFFVGPVTDLLNRCDPALWIHGHTHEPCDYVLGSTRVVANPLGYPGEWNEGEFRPDLMIEI